MLSLGTVIALIKKLAPGNPAQIEEIQEELNQQKNAIEGILVQEGESVSLTNMLNISGFYNGITSSSGLSPVSLKDGIGKWKITNSTEVSPYFLDAGAWGTKKWIVGFKYKLTKADPNLGNPENVRIHLGTTAYDETPVWGEWVYFKKCVTLDLTRLRFALRNFASAPPADSATVEIKELYIYDVTGIESDICDLIMNQQETNYTDGTVTYHSGGDGYVPDVTLSEEGKVPDSKATGDAIRASGNIINVKYYGVKGNGTDDDTDAINDLFMAKSGNFYFPAGTYKISGTINLPADSAIIGGGDSTIINMYSCNDLTECTFRTGEKVYPYILTTGDHTKFCDFKLIGNNTTENKRHAGIAVMDAEDCVIDHVTVYNINYYASQSEPNVKGYGISIIRSSRAYIDHCYVEQCGYECIGIADMSHHCVVSNCIAKNGWRTCMQIHRGAHDVIFIGNEFIQDSQEWDACFTLHGLADSNLVTNLRIENNTFKAEVASRQRTENYASVVQLMSYCDGLWFVNNRIESGDRGLFSSDTNSHFFMIGNLFQCEDQTDYRIKINTVDSVVVGNVCENAASGQIVIASGAVKAGNIGFD